MTSPQSPTYLGLPQTHNGRVLAYLLVAATIVSLLALGTTAPSAGYRQLFLSLAACSLLVIHHITVFCLHKNQVHTHKSYQVHDRLARKTNIGFLVLTEATLVVSVRVGSYFYTRLQDSTDDNYPPLALVSTLFALFECLILTGIILYRVVARREKQIDARELA